MWNLLEDEGFAPEVLGTFVDLVDFWHLIEKLAPAAKILHGEGPHRTTLRRWRIALRRRSSGAAEILAELRASNRERVVVNNQQPVHEAITYIENHGHRMNYAAARRKHLSIGSGNAEATCKTLIQVRLKLAGSRWKHATGEHIVKLRALMLSTRWDDALTLLHTLCPLLRMGRGAAASLRSLPLLAFPHGMHTPMPPMPGNLTAGR